ncbi:MAG: hypothetical protein AAFN59_08640 [Pseudomonadota bacterium]
MTMGWIISGVAHGALILVLLVGGIFNRDRLPPVSVAEVSILTEAQFAALMPAGDPPRLVTEAVQPASPPIEEETPATPQEDTQPDQSEPGVTEPPDAPSSIPETPDPLPAPVAVEDTEPAPPTPPSQAQDTPVIAALPPPPAPRVAPEPAAPPPPDAERAPDVIQDSAPAPEPDPEPVVEDEPPAAPEEATTEIVTEAEQSDPTSLRASDVTASVRPKARPRTITAAPEPATTPAVQPAPSSTDAAVAAAVDTPRPAVPSGPPLTGGERDALRLAVASCWVVDVGSQSANVTITVAVSMNRDGTVVGNAVRRVSATGGDDAAQRSAFEKARRAILRCQRGGFPLPVEKYEQWREIEMVFNPEGMRLK